MSDDNRITKPTAREVCDTIMGVLKKYDPEPHAKLELDELDEEDEIYQEYDVGGVCLSLSGQIACAMLDLLDIEYTKGAGGAQQWFNELMGPPQIVDTPEGQFVQLPA